MADVLEQIEAVSLEAEQELSAVTNPAQLEQFRIKFLGVKGSIKGLMKLLGQIPKEQKPEVGQKINAMQDRVNAGYEARKAALATGRERGGGSGRDRAGTAAANWEPAYPDEGG